MLTIEHQDIAALSAGERKANTVFLFLHGWQDNAASFHSVLTEMVTTYPEHSYLAIDWPGHGLSAHRSSDNYYHFFDYIDDLHQVVVNLSANRLVIVGHSLGALVASCYSAAFPEQVSALVMIEGLGPLAESESNAVNRLRTGILSRQRLRKKSPRTLRDQKEALKLRMAANQLPENLLWPIVERGTRFDGQHWYWSHDPKLKCDSLYRMAEEHAHSLMRDIQCPSLCILGQQGFHHLKDHSQRATSFKNLQVRAISGGHHCHLEQPKSTAELIFALLNKIQTSD